MIAVDDGIASGNFNAADIFFLVAAIIAVIAGVLTVAKTTAVKFASLLGWLAVAGIAFGLFLL